MKRRRTGISPALEAQYLADVSARKSAEPSATASATTTAFALPVRGEAAHAQAGDDGLRAALAKIEQLACEAIYDTGVTQERNREAWVSIGDAVLKACAPIRDLARAALRE